jgi:hypothetical protein
VVENTHSTRKHPDRVIALQALIRHRSLETAVHIPRENQTSWIYRMKDLLVRLLLAAAVTLLFARASPADEQQADEGPTPAAPQQKSSEATPSSPQQQGNAQTPTSEETQTQDAYSFTGGVVRENGKIILKDPVTKVSYQIRRSSKG